MHAAPPPNERILVIDDDVVMRELLSLLLASPARSVSSAEDGEQALKYLDSLAPAVRPNVILSDLRMPGLTAGALGLRLRLLCPPPALLIAMSGSDPDAGPVVPFDAFLSKPFTVEQFEAALNRLQPPPAPPAAKQRPPRTSRAGRKAAPVEVPPLDETTFSTLVTLMGPQQLPQLYALFLEDAPARVARMQAAAAINDAATFSREAHAIKGGCGMLGATEIHFIASQLETGGLACSPLLNDFEQAFERLRRILKERLDGPVEQRVDPLP